MQLKRIRMCKAAGVLLTSLTLATCGGGDKGPGAGGGTPTQPVEPTPTPAAQATPEPPVSASCERLPLGSSTYRCNDEAPSFQRELDDSINELKDQHPEYFIDNRYVANIGGYIVGLIRNLDKKGICAGYDGEELAVKNTPDYNDQYDILTSKNEVRSYYIGTCYPALFPAGRHSSAPPSGNGCSLPTSIEIACGNPDPQFVGDVAGAVEQVMDQKPELFDFTQKANDWPLVKDMEAYHAAVVATLATKGYCGKFDGEEIQVKRTNEFTEHYDINYADRYIRKGPGIYRGACYPASF